MHTLPRARIGDMLVTAGCLTEKQLEWALERQKEDYKRIGEILLDNGLAMDDDVAEARALQMEMPYVDLDDFVIPPDVAGLIPENIARTYSVLPVDATGDRIAIATANPMDVEAIDAVQRYARKRVEPLLASASHVHKMIDRVYGTMSGDDITASIEEAVEDVDVSVLTPEQADDVAEERRKSGQAPVIKAVNLVLQEAVKQHASDIHFEPRATGVEIRYRIDGALRHIRELPKQLQAAVTSRVKIMAEMDIAEKRRPQDGRIALKFPNKNIDLRISSLPVQHGERIVIRVLDKSSTMLGIDKLGFGDRELKQFLTMLQKPNGIILVTGPTGSGKTTTLYSALGHIKSPDTNIMTCEDPIEYELDGINQSAVNVKAGLTFPAQLRAILRQDPDVILVGEIRDKETATIAFQAAMTGHLVFSTLHCNDAPSAITRLMDMGVEPFLIGSSIVGVLAQRLVKQLCPKCKATHIATVDELAQLGMKPNGHDVELYGSVGCPTCDGRGYTGRLPILELMPVSEQMRYLTLQRPTADQVRELAVRAGMKTMREHAIEQILAGLTTTEEARKRVFIEQEE